MTCQWFKVSPHLQKILFVYEILQSKEYITLRRATTLYSLKTMARGRGQRAEPEVDIKMLSFPLEVTTGQVWVHERDSAC